MAATRLMGTFGNADLAEMPWHWPSFHCQCVSAPSFPLMGKAQPHPGRVIGSSLRCEQSSLPHAHGQSSSPLSLSTLPPPPPLPPFPLHIDCLGQATSLYEQPYHTAHSHQPGPHLCQGLFDDSQAENPSLSGILCISFDGLGLNIHQPANIISCSLLHICGIGLIST